MERVVKMKIGSIVKLQDDNEWNGFYGVVKYMKNETAYVFCIQNPCYLYKVGKENDILIINN
jgi:hypothetical protein